MTKFDNPKGLTSEQFQKHQATHKTVHVPAITKSTSQKETPFLKPIKAK